MCGNKIRKSITKGMRTVMKIQQCHNTCGNKIRKIQNDKNHYTLS